MAGWQRSIRRPPRPKDNNRNNNEDDNDDNHRGEVETNAREGEESNCYLAPFHNTIIQYVVAAIV